AAAQRGARGGVGEQRAGTRLDVRIVGAPAGDADIDGGEMFVGRGHPRLLRAELLLRHGCHACRSIPPEAPRPAGTSPRRQVSWLAGPRPSPPSREVPVAQWFGLAADSCGGSCGLGALLRPRTAFPVRSLNERPSMRRNRRAGGGFVNARTVSSPGT